jgi:hypothetical protein
VTFPVVTFAPVSRRVTRMLAVNGAPARGVSGTTTTRDADSRTAVAADATGIATTTTATPTGSNHRTARTIALYLRRGGGLRPSTLTAAGIDPPPPKVARLSAG